jgi:hypothetical protein
MIAGGNRWRANGILPAKQIRAIVRVTKPAALLPSETESCLACLRATDTLRAPNISEASVSTNVFR